MSDDSIQAKRDPTSGRLLPGTPSLNPRGRSQALPEWFTAKGEESLKMLWDYASGANEDRDLSQAKCVLEVIERIYGKAPKALDLTGVDLNPVALALAALANRSKTEA